MNFGIVASFLAGAMAVSSFMEWDKDFRIMAHIGLIVVAAILGLIF